MSAETTTPKMPRVPAELGWLADVVGADGTLAVVENFGGTRLYIPKKSTGYLTKLLPADALAELCRIWGGHEIKILSCKAWRIRVYHARGMSYPQIARCLQVDENTVHRHLQAAQLTRQRDLFALD